MDYFTNLPEEAYNNTIANEFIRVAKNLDFIKSSTNRNLSCLDSPKHEFMILMHALEKLFFLDKPKEEITHTNQCTKVSGNLFNAYLDMFGCPSFIFSINSKHEYRETGLEVKHLEVLENTLKTDRQFLKIMTCGNTLAVYTNKQPTWEQLIKLKIMQWKLFEEHITTPEPNIIRFLQAMLHKDLGSMNKYIHEILNRPDFVEHKLSEVKEVFQRGLTQSTRTIEDEINRLQEVIMDYENCIRDYLISLKEKNIMLDALRNQPEEDLRPIIKYLSKHPYIHNIRKRDEETITLDYEAPIVYFDTYVLKKVYDRRVSNLEKQILNIFRQNEYELITRCSINFNTSNFRVSFNVLGTDSHSNTIAHPHIDRFQCFGNHNDPLKEAAKERNYFGAIEQISQAVLNLNFSDSYVIDTMLSLLKNLPSTPTWRHKETHVMCSTKEVIEQYAED